MKAKSKANLIIIVLDMLYRDYIVKTYDLDDAITAIVNSIDARVDKQLHELAGVNRY